jgi:hypothetical protein
MDARTGNGSRSSSFKSARGGSRMGCNRASPPISTGVRHPSAARNEPRSKSKIDIESPAGGSAPPAGTIMPKTPKINKHSALLIMKTPLQGWPIKTRTSTK